MVAPRRRGLVRDLGPCQARGGAGAWLLPCRRHRTRDRLRYRLCRRRRPDRLSAGTADESARHAISPLAGRHAPRHGTDADGGCDVRPRGRRVGLCDAVVSIGRTRSTYAGFRRARRQGAGGVAAAQQALGASRDGDHGRTRRDARRYRNPGAGVHHRGLAQLHGDVPPRWREASSRSSTSATRRSGITGRGRSRRTLIPSRHPSATRRSSRRTANKTPRPAASPAASPPSARPTGRRRRRRVRSGSPPARSCWRCSG